MRKQILIGAAILAFSPLSPLGAQEYRVPETRDHPASERTAHFAAITPAQLSEIVAWLTKNFDLPAAAEHPRVEFAPPLKIAAMRYKNVLPLAWRGDSIPDPNTQAAYLREVVAIYNDTSKTIFLAEGWTGTSPAEMSILVHEMVHHLQNTAGMKFECAAAREKVAYQAQNQWLGQFGRDLETDFDIDMFTLLVSTGCMN